ncbi:armadillo-type protein [Umbelopsis sp. PMI_123]|nr:armadillo-type protein [Umbelopsis sp. PMI_123]
MSIQEIEATVARLTSLNDDELNSIINDLATSLSDNLAMAKDQLSTDVSNDGHWKNATKMTELCANTARDERTREPLGNTGVIQTIAEIMKLTNSGRTEYLIQALRSFGNLCFDQDGNRKLVAETGVISTIVRGLGSKNPAVVRTTCGALMNLCIDCDEIQEQVCECNGIQALRKLLEPAQMDHGEDAMVTTAAKLLTILQGNEKAVPQIAAEDGISKIIGLIRYSWTVDKLEDMDLIEYLSEILQHVLAENEYAQVSTGKSLSFITLLDFIEQAEISDDADEEEQKQFDQICKSFVKAIVDVSLADDNLSHLYENSTILNRYLKWIEATDDERITSDMQTCAALSLGNLARTEQHCVDLVHKYHVEISLLRLLKKTTDLRVQHAVVSILKNLSLPKQNKQSIGAAGAISVVSPYLDASKDMLKPVQFAVIGILKLLSVGDDFNATQMVTADQVLEDGGSDNISPLDRVLDFINRVDDVAARSEATRVLVNLIKTAWSQENISSGVLRERLCSKKVVTALTALVCTSKFSILQNEGIIALTLLFTQQSSDEFIQDGLAVFVAPEESLSHVTDESTETQSEPLEKATLNLFQVLLRIIIENDAQMPDQVRCNACVLLERAFLAAKKVHSDNLQLMKEEVHKQLDNLDALPASLQERISQLRIASS